jgi:hypothetical protein
MQRWSGAKAGARRLWTAPVALWDWRVQLAAWVWGCDLHVYVSISDPSPVKI